MIRHSELEKAQLGCLIKSGQVKFGGHKRLKIYGLLSCKSGRRMLQENRVFFSSEKEAESLGYRPCGHCMRDAYLAWKSGSDKDLHK